MALYLREGLGCTAPRIGDGTVESVWVRMKGKASKMDVVVGVCCDHQPGR